MRCPECESPGCELIDDIHTPKFSINQYKCKVCGEIFEKKFE